MLVDIGVWSYMPKKGHKSTKGIGDLWNERKSNRVNISLTDTGKRELQIKADKLGISISELVERVARGELVRNEDPVKKNLMDLSIKLPLGIQILHRNPNEIN